MTTHSTSEQIENKDVHVKDAKCAPKDVSGSKRKKLKTIQLAKQEDCLTRDGTLISSKTKSAVKFLRIHTVNAPISIYEDPARLTASDPRLDESTQMDAEKCGCTCQEEEKLQLSAEEEEISDKYWRDYSETQREALTEALHVNEVLHNQVLQVTEDNKRLEEEVKKCEKIAEFLNEVAGAGQTTENQD